MNWYGPSGDCGCCPGADPCDSLPDCDDYPDLETCECVDYISGVVQTRTKLIMNITGSAGIGEDGPLSPKVILDAVDVSGSYEFDLDDNGFGACVQTFPFTEYILEVVFVGSDGGLDFYAMLVIAGEVSSVLVQSLIKFVAAGDPPPTTTSGAGLSRQKRFRYTPRYPCGDVTPTCLCPFNHTFTVENAGSTGWDLSGVGLATIVQVFA